VAGRRCQDFVTPPYAQVSFRLLKIIYKPTDTLVGVQE